MKYHVEKTIEINAPLETVRDLAADFSKWNNWSPWAIVDPDSETGVSGEAGVVGHAMQWDGEIIGSGKMELSSVSDEQLMYDLEFVKPFKSKATSAFLFSEHDGRVKVTWTMDSSLPFFLFFMVKTMKNWVGMDYERGLRMMKEIAEKGSVHAKTTNVGVSEYKGFSYIGIERSLPIDEMPEKMSDDFKKIVDDVVIKAGKSAEHWVCLYPKFNMRTMMGTYVAAISDENFTDSEIPQGYVRGSIADGNVLQITHDGSYDFLGNAWSMGMMLVQAKKMKNRGIPFEQYWNSPLEVAPEDLKTSVFFPVK